MKFFKSLSSFLQKKIKSFHIYSGESDLPNSERPAVRGRTDTKRRLICYMNAYTIRNDRGPTRPPPDDTQR